ncbi:CPS_collapsed_G0054210.mRNA.1.CDS.1 [Saccharomyces cerevisiae]|nr:CPS_collapsed_G0054210.mRNA.1.CDS.1 [Saccharomyces cerevisiae]
MSAEDYKNLPVTVEKPIPVVYDLGNLAAFDSNILNARREEKIKSLTRDNVQLLINQLLSLPMKTTTESVGGTGGQSSVMTLLQLPDPTTDLLKRKATAKG